LVPAARAGYRLWRSGWRTDEGIPGASSSISSIFGSITDSSAMAMEEAAGFSRRRVARAAQTVVRSARKTGEKPPRTGADPPSFYAALHGQCLMYLLSVPAPADRIVLALESTESSRQSCCEELVGAATWLWQRGDGAASGARQRLRSPDQAWAPAGRDNRPWRGRSAG
jgi:hypothetical protein